MQEVKLGSGGLAVTFGVERGRPLGHKLRLCKAGGRGRRYREYHRISRRGASHHTAADTDTEGGAIVFVRLLLVVGIPYVYFRRGTIVGEGCAVLTGYQGETDHIGRKEDQV